MAELTKEEIQAILNERRDTNPHMLYQPLYFKYDHLPTELQFVGKAFEVLRGSFELISIEDKYEYKEGMRKLLEAKDCFVRAFFVGKWLK
jgi:hypothetical protein